MSKHDKPEWSRQFMSHAELAARMSKDSTQVGAALVSPEGVVIMTSFNGIPSGVDDIPERRERPVKYDWTQHGERNLISFAARYGIKTEGCTVYVTHSCCSQCLGGLIQAGVKRIVYGAGTTSMPAEMFDVAHTMAREAGIRYEAYEG